MKENTIGLSLPITFVKGQHTITERGIGLLKCMNRNFQKGICQRNSSKGILNIIAVVFSRERKSQSIST